MSMAQTVVSQFRQPRGLLGRIAGFIMATRPSNIERNTWTLDLLDLQANDRVLEVGYGPGIAIGYAAEKIKGGVIVGVDHSQTMFSQASARNARAIESGRVRLMPGSLEQLTGYQCFFDKIYSANVVQFWPDPGACYVQLGAVLKPGGKIATTYMPRHRGATRADSRNQAEAIAECLGDAGYRNIQVNEKAFGSTSAVCVVAQK